MSTTSQALVHVNMYSMVDVESIEFYFEAAENNFHMPLLNL